MTILVIFSPTTENSLKKNWGPNSHFEVQISIGLRTNMYISLAKHFFFMAANASFQGVVCQSEFLHHRKKPDLIFSKWLFFQNETYSGKMQVKNRMNYEKDIIIFWIETEYIHGWKVWGWTIHGWKVRGQIWGLKNPGLRCPSTAPITCCISSNILFYKNWDVVPIMHKDNSRGPTKIGVKNRIKRVL